MKKYLSIVYPGAAWRINLAFLIAVLFPFYFFYRVQTEFQGLLCISLGYGFLSLALLNEFIANKVLGAPSISWGLRRSNAQMQGWPEFLRVILTYLPLLFSLFSFVVAIISWYM